MASGNAKTATSCVDPLPNFKLLLGLRSTVRDLKCVGAGQSVVGNGQEWRFAEWLSLVPHEPARKAVGGSGDGAPGGLVMITYVLRAPYLVRNSTP